VLGESAPRFPTGCKHMREDIAAQTTLLSALADVKGGRKGRTNAAENKGDEGERNFQKRNGHAKTEDEGEWKIQIFWHEEKEKG